MLYDWTPERYRRRQPSCWDPPWTRRTTAHQQSSSYELDMYSPSPPRRRPTCWDPPRSRDPPAVRPYDQLPPRYRREPYGSTHPHRMGSVQTRRPTCWDPPRHRTDNSYPPPYRDPDMVPDSYVEPRDSYARYRPWQPQYQPRSATKVEDPINAKLDRLLKACDKIETWFEATNRRFSKFRSSPQPEADLDQPNVFVPLRKRANPPSRNNETSFGPSGLPPNVSSAPPRHRTIEYTNRRSDLQSLQRSSMTSHCHSVAPPPVAASVRSSNLPQPATIVAKQPHQDYQPPPTLPKSDRQSQQPSPPPPLELLPYFAPGPSQPLQPLPETAPLLDSNRLPSSRSEEGQTNLQNVDEYSLINKVVPCSHDVVGENNIVGDKWKEKEMGPKGLVGSKDEEDSDIFRMIKVIILRAFDPGICVSFSKRRGKADSHESEKELPLEGVIKCLFAAAETFRVELHMLAKHFVFTNARKFNGDDEGKRSTARCVFDPGGDASPRLLPSTLDVGSWFPP